VRKPRNVAIFSGRLYHLPENINSTAKLAEFFRGTQVRGVFLTHHIGNPESIAKDVEHHLQGAFSGRFSIRTRRFSVAGTPVHTVCLLAD
jgi:hypothetical protein